VLRQTVIDALCETHFDLQSLKVLPIPGGMEKYFTWQDPDKHSELRKEFLKTLLRHVVSKKLNAPRKWYEMCSRILPKVEFHLYLSSTNNKDYVDLSTLKKRVQLFLAAKTAVATTRPQKQARTE
jgi:hypothetical protein